MLLSAGVDGFHLFFFYEMCIRDSNYSETRLPAVPSTIVDLLSHENFADMRLGHDPNFKFTVGRALYKAILQYICSQHGRDYVVQPA